MRLPLFIMTKTKSMDQVWGLNSTTPFHSLFDFLVPPLLIKTLLFSQPPLLTLLGFRQRYITFWEFNGLIAMLLITGYIVSTINPKSNQEIWRWIDFYQFVGETAEAFLAKIWSYFTVPRLCLTLALTWVFVNIRLRFQLHLMKNISTKLLIENRYVKAHLFLVLFSFLIYFV